jgi:hypothetical protein
MSRKYCGVNGVYYGLKSSIFIEVDDLWITGSTPHIIGNISITIKRLGYTISLGSCRLHGVTSR